MDQIEFEEPTYSTCACCGEQTTHLVRFVNREDAAFAVYFADFSPGRDFVSLMAGFGDWGEDAPADRRTAFPFRIWKNDDAYQVGLVNADEASYRGTFLGRVLDRSEALEHPLKGELFALSDHIVECDQAIVDFLAAAAPIAPSRH